MAAMAGNGRGGRCCRCEVNGVLNRTCRFGFDKVRLARSWVEWWRLRRRGADHELRRRCLHCGGVFAGVGYRLGINLAVVWRAVLVACLYANGILMRNLCGKDVQEELARVYEGAGIRRAGDSQWEMADSLPGGRAVVPADVPRLPTVYDELFADLWHRLIRLTRPSMHGETRRWQPSTIRSRRWHLDPQIWKGSRCCVIFRRFFGILGYR